MDTNNTELLDALEALAKAEERADLMMMAADTDELTGLLNRRGLTRRAGTRDWGWYVAADLDGFKLAQDGNLRGHAYGDEVLQEFADFIMMNTRQRKREGMRALDLLAARTGGDEFTVWCETRAGARRIKDAIREWVSTDGAVRASAGLGDSIESADGACYSDKLTRKARRTA
jgi:diguanylate cyclase (GGDEF)-like protein